MLTEFYFIFFIFEDIYIYINFQFNDVLIVRDDFILESEGHGSHFTSELDKIIIRNKSWPIKLIISHVHRSLKVQILVRSRKKNFHRYH